ncbi:MAG: hypothetical protein IH805_05540 [Proteobacteria bacterium]|nr:hypothetical protein [Pseudomonadota bacterium]
MGELVGTRQAGGFNLRWADLAEDVDLVELARRKALDIIAVDPMLARPEHQPLRRRIERRYELVFDGFDSRDWRDIEEYLVISPGIGLQLLADGLSAPTLAVILLLCTVLAVYSIRYVEHRAEILYHSEGKAAQVGYHVQTFATFPSQILGGPTWTQTRISNVPVLGSGDELQGIKKGVLELADSLVVNKADSAQREAAERCAGEYARALGLLRAQSPNWAPRVLMVSSLQGTGIDAVWETIMEHMAALESSGERQALRKEQARQWMWSLVEEGLRSAFRAHPDVSSQIDPLEQAVQNLEISPAAAAKALLERNPDPTETETRYWLAGNLCRCTGYDKIIRAVMDAAEQMRGA